jgi:NHL repeat
VADAGNNRVLEYSAPFSQGKTGGFTAIKVYGQSGSFTSGTCDIFAPPTANSLCSPGGLALDTHNNLYVADKGNNRVLVYSGGSTSATREFGQGASGTDFTNHLCNNGSFSASSSSMCGPAGVATDIKNNVYIADSANSRVLKFNQTTNPPSNFIANKVFGQDGSFSTSELQACNLGGLSAGSLCSPVQLTIDSNSNLYVADAANNRVLEYSAPFVGVAPTAHLVFGQADNFGTRACNLAAGLSADSLCSPAGIALDSSRDLFIGDQANNRVLKYLQPLALPGVVALTPNPLAFGDVAKGTTSAARTITAKNTAIVPITFAGVSITGANAADFKLVSNSCAGGVKGAAACAVAVTLTPTKPAGTAEKATVSLMDSGSKSPQTVTLSGTSVASTKGSL